MIGSHCTGTLTVFIFWGRGGVREIVKGDNQLRHVRPTGSTRLPLDGFSWNLIFEYFFPPQICWENSSFIKIQQKSEYFTWRPKYVYDDTSLIASYNENCLMQEFYRNSKIHILFILVINQLDAQNLFYNTFISRLYMFRAPCAHRQEVKNCIIQHLVSSHL